MSTGLGGVSFQVRADPAQFVAGMKRAKEEAMRTSQQIGAAVQTIGSQTTVGLGAASRNVDKLTKSFDALGSKVGGAKGGHLGLGLLAIGQMADDMQYGFRSIVNNIPQVVYMMGGSAGLAGGAALAAVGINLLVTRWDSLVDAMRGRWLNVAASDLEKLRIATEKAGDAFDALMKTPDEAGGRMISQLKEAMVDAKGGAAAVFKGLKGTIALEPSMRAEEGPVELHRRRILEGTIRRMEAPGFHNQMGQIPLVDLKKELKAMDDKLDDLNGSTAKTLQGSVISAGENQVAELAKMRMLVEKNPNAFPADFRARLQRITPEIIQGELDLENQKKAREKARGVAGQMIGGPLGTQVMLGGGTGGPLGTEAITKMMGGPMSRRLGARGLKDAAGQMEGMTAEQAKGVMKAMDVRKMYEAGKKRSQELGVPLGGLGQIDPRVLDEVYKKTFAEALKANKGKPGGIEAAVGKALKGAGVIGQDAGAVLAEMKAQIADRKKDLMLSGMTAKQAEMQILKDQQQRAFPAANMPAQFIGIAQLAKASQLNALNGSDVAKRSLEELMAIRKGIAMLRGQQVMNAVAAGPN